MKYAADTTAAEGVIESVSCEKAKPKQLVLETGDKTLHFRVGKTYGMGFTDTLWYGEDHFNPCHHLEGMKAVIRYKASPDQNDDNELRWLEIRDELTPDSVVTSANR